MFLKEVINMPCCFFCGWLWILLFMIEVIRLCLTLAYGSTEFEEWAWLVRENKRPEIKEDERGIYD